MVREGNGRRHVPQDHVRVDFAMSVVLGSKILGLQGNEERLRLRGVDVLDARTEPLGPIVEFLGRLRDGTVHEAEHGAHQTTCVGLDGKGAVERRPRNAGVGMNGERMLGLTENLRENIGLLRVGHENSVEVDGGALLHARLLDPRQGLLLEKVKHDERRRVLCDTRKHGEILDNADRVALRGLDGAHKSP